MTFVHSLLGYAGLIPFVMLPVLFALGYLSTQAWLLSYAALIFSFLGGVQWMATLNSQSNTQNNSPTASQSTLKQWVSVSTMLWAWLWLIVPQVDWLLWAGLSFWAIWLYERVVFKTLFSTDFMQMRRNLSLVAGFSLIAANLL